jgi:hypothetical protein
MQRRKDEKKFQGFRSVFAFFKTILLAKPIRMHLGLVFGPLLTASSTNQLPASTRLEPLMLAHAREICAQVMDVCGRKRRITTEVELWRNARRTNPPVYTILNLLTPGSSLPNLFRFSIGAFNFAGST